MTIYKEIIVNAETGEITKVEFTQEELKAFNAQQKKLEQEKLALVAEEQAKAEARQSALEKLAAIGLTEAEIQALAG